MKVMITFGTRPEAIKMATLCHLIKNSNSKIEVTVCVTGQHREMLDQAMRVFGLVPDIDLNIMKPKQDLFDVTSSVLLGMREILTAYKPNIMLVHGDTTTSAYSAIAAFYLGIPVGHVEAGLRTHNINAPFPEEFNRRVISKIASHHFAPTSASKANLINEGVLSENIVVTGNTVIDALLWVVEKFESDPDRLSKIRRNIYEKTKINIDYCSYILITGHRRENFGEGFVDICLGIRELAYRYPKIKFIYPVHLNPQVQKPVHDILSKLENVHLIEPLEYEPFVYLLKNCLFVITDSGGIQEEAPSLGKPVLVLREVTERPEAIAAGTSMLVGANSEKIISAGTSLIEDKELYQRMSKATNPYGDGLASERILARLMDFYG
jgi:UDP-N-acetylglucosamine 2-epimerase (non-hydrolysing)